MADNNMETLPPEKQHQHQIEATVKTTLHKGPLPDPITLEQYNKVDPKASAMILSVFKEQANHRMQMEKMQMQNLQAQTAIDKKYAEDEIALARRGVNYAFILSLLVIAAGFYLIAFSGHEIIGTLFSGVGLSPLVSRFIKDTRNHPKEKK